MGSLGGGEWRIKGVYEHQVLKAGLRRLDQNWPVDGLLELPSGIFRQKILRDLLSGMIRLQSVPNNDVSAAQRDIQKLSLRQLLRLRVLHIDFTPSGAGADTIHSVGGTHEAFLSTLDGLLFQQLGQKAAADLDATFLGIDSSDTARKGSSPEKKTAAADTSK